MQEIKSYQDLNEKAIEIILNFKVEEKFDKAAVNQILKLKSDIKRSIAILSKQEQEVIELRYFQNLSNDKVAQKLGKTKDEVVQILLKGIESIKENIRKGIPEATKVDNVVDFVKVGSPLQNQASSLMPKKQLLWWSGFLSMMVFTVIFVAACYVMQRIFSDQISNFFRENIFQSRDKKNANTIDQTKIKISGSTSLLVLSRRWENAFSIEYPKYHLSLIPSDSAQGISALIEGDIDVANSSRPLSFSDQKKAAEAGKELTESRVAIDALIILVNKNNPVEELSLDDLEGIFNGDIKDWKSLSVLIEPVIPIVREKGSGTNDFVINRILQGSNFPKFIIRKNSNDEVMKFISENEGAIGFINSTNYLWENSGIKYVKIRSYPDSLSISPFQGQKLNEQALRYGDYPLAHYLYLVTLVEAPERVKEFIDWVLSDKGQEIVSYSGLIPVRREG